MTTMTAPARASGTVPARTTGRAGFTGILRSEWIKLSTVRSTWWSLTIVALLTIGVAVLAAAAMEDGPGFEPIQAVATPGQLTMLVVAILGVVSVTGEYSSGMIRATFTATPARGTVLAAKAIVMAVTMFVASAVIMFGAALAITPLFAARDMTFPWHDPAASTLPLLAASASMAVYAIIGLGFGFLLRAGAGAIASAMALLLVLPVVLAVLGGGGEGFMWLAEASWHLPTAASQSLILPQDGWGLSPAAAALTLAGWSAAALLASWATLRVRDA